MVAISQTDTSQNYNKFRKQNKVRNPQHGVTPSSDTSLTTMLHRTYRCSEIILWQ